MTLLMLPYPLLYFIPLIVGCGLGILIVLDPFLSNIMANWIDITVAGINIFKLYPYELSSLILLAVFLLPFVKQMLENIFINIERIFIIIFFIGTYIVSLTKISRFDLSELVIILFSMLLLLKFMVENNRFKVPPIVILNFIFFASLYLSSMNAGVMSILDNFLTSVKFTLLTFLISNFIHDRNLLGLSLKVVVVLTVISSLIGIVQEIIYITLGIPIVGFVDAKDIKLYMFEVTSFGTFLRVPAFFGTYKPFTLFLVMAILIIFNYLLYQKPSGLKKNITLIFSILLMFTALILTFTKDGLLSLFVGVIFSIILRKPPFIFYVIICFLIGAALYLSGFLDDLQKEISSEFYRGEYRIRLQLAREGILGFMHKHPWIGVGLRNTREYTGHFYGWPAHNPFILAADAFGIVGLLLYVILLGFSLLNLIKVNLIAEKTSDKWIARALLSAFIAILTLIQFTTLFLERFMWMYMGIIQACTIVMVKNTRTRCAFNEQSRS